MSGWNRKKGSGGTLSGTPHRDGRFYRIAQIYERTRAQDGADDTIDLTWTTGRDSPTRSRFPCRCRPRSGTIGGHGGLPGAPVVARPGHGAASDTNAGGTLFVTLFGLTGEQLGKAVSRIERQVQPTRDMRPVFLTDQPDTSIFRLGGFSYEYLPASIFGSPTQAPLFATRFETLWRKWNAMLLIDFSASGYLAARLENLETYVDREFFDKDRYDPRRPKPAPPRPGDGCGGAACVDYRASGLDEEPDTFVLYRMCWATICRPATRSGRRCPTCASCWTTSRSSRPAKSAGSSTASSTPNRRPRSSRSWRSAGSTTCISLRPRRIRAGRLGFRRVPRRGFLPARALRAR
jgi:hypothetical protein